MNPKEWSKEQKQMAVLGVMSVVVVFALGNQLVLGPLKSQAADAEQILQEKGTEKASGERILRRDPLLRRELAADVKAIADIRNQSLIPPGEGKEFWAQKRLRPIGYELDLDLSVSRHIPPQPRHLTLKAPSGSKGPDGDTVASDEKKLSFWIPYPVEIETRLSFSQLNALLSELHRAEPYASVGLLQVKPSVQDPIRHNVRILVQWPIPRFETEWDELTEELPEASS